MGDQYLVKGTYKGKCVYFSTPTTDNTRSQCKGDGMTMLSDSVAVTEDPEKAQVLKQDKANNVGKNLKNCKMIKNESVEKIGIILLDEAKKNYTEQKEQPKKEQPEKTPSGPIPPGPDEKQLVQEICGMGIIKKREKKDPCTATRPAGPGIAAPDIAAPSRTAVPLPAGLDSPVDQEDADNCPETGPGFTMDGLAERIRSIQDLANGYLAARMHRAGMECLVKLLTIAQDRMSFQMYSLGTEGKEGTDGAHMVSRFHDMRKLRRYLKDILFLRDEIAPYMEEGKVREHIGVHGYPWKKLDTLDTLDVLDIQMAYNSSWTEWEDAVTKEAGKIWDGMYHGLESLCWLIGAEEEIRKIGTCLNMYKLDIWHMIENNGLNDKEKLDAYRKVGKMEHACVLVGRASSIHTGIAHGHESQYEALLKQCKRLYDKEYGERLTRKRAGYLESFLCGDGGWADPRREDSPGSQETSGNPGIAEGAGGETIWGNGSAGQAAIADAGQDGPGAGNGPEDRPGNGTGSKAGGIWIGDAHTDGSMDLSGTGRHADIFTVIRRSDGAGLPESLSDPLDRLFDEEDVSPLDLDKLKGPDSLDMPDREERRLPDDDDLDPFA